MDERREPEETEADRRRTNIMLLVFFAAVVGIGIWLVNSLAEHRRIDDCLAQGRRNCAPVDVPSR